MVGIARNHPNDSAMSCCVHYATRKSTRKLKMALVSPLASLRAQLVKNLPAMQETPVRFLGLEDLLEKG